MGARSGTYVRTAGLATVAAASLLAAACSITSEDGETIVLGGDRVQGSGEVISETRTVAEFERIVLAGEGQVLLGSGSEGEVEVETDDNLLTHIEVEVSEGTLTISTEPDVDIDPTDGVTYRLGCPEITAATLAGAGTIDLQMCATTVQLELVLAGAGAIVAPDLDVSSLRASLPGAGSIEADGRADRIDVLLAGVAAFDGADLRAAEGTVESSGVGAAAVWVTDSLDLRLSGVGGISYYGEPTVTQTVTGVGGIEALGPR